MNRLNVDLTQNEIDTVIKTLDDGKLKNYLKTFLKIKKDDLEEQVFELAKFYNLPTIESFSDFDTYVQFRFKGLPMIMDISMRNISIEGDFTVSVGLDFVNAVSNLLKIRNS